MIVDKTGSIFLAGSYLVKAAIGEDIDNETLGGATTQCEISGVTDNKFQDDKAALDHIISLIGIHPGLIGVGRVPVGHFAHIGDINRGDAFGLFGQFGVAEHLVDGGKPHRFIGLSVDEKLRFGAGVLGKVHGAIMAHGRIGNRLRRGRRGGFAVAAASGQP